MTHRIIQYSVTSNGTGAHRIWNSSTSHCTPYTYIHSRSAEKKKNDREFHEKKAYTWNSTLLIASPPPETTGLSCSCRPFNRRVVYIIPTSIYMPKKRATRPQKRESRPRGVPLGVARVYNIPLLLVNAVRTRALTGHHNYTRARAESRSAERCFRACGARALRVGYIWCTVCNWARGGNVGTLRLSNRIRTHIYRAMRASQVIRRRRYIGAGWKVDMRERWVAARVVVSRVDWCGDPWCTRNA